MARKRYDEAMTYASRTYGIVEEHLKRRKLDDEPRLPIALGAAIEVQALAMAGQGRRSEALMHLQREIEQFKGTSIIMRLNKNMHVIGLEGKPAFPLTSKEWLGPKTPTLAELKGKPVVIFAWAHWCGDCKTQGPLLEAVVNKYKDSGIVVIAPTQRFGYAEKRRPVGPAEELTYIEQVRDRVLSVDEDGVGAGERRGLPEVRRLDDADLRDDRSRRQGVDVSAGTADDRTDRRAGSEDRQAGDDVEPGAALGLASCDSSWPPISSSPLVSASPCRPKALAAGKSSQVHFQLHARTAESPS